MMISPSTIFRSRVVASVMKTRTMIFPSVTKSSTPSMIPFTTTSSLLGRGQGDAGGWPSTNDNQSGGSRSNNPPKKGGSKSKGGGGGGKKDKSKKGK